jgi:hypothetical protein
MGFVRPPIQSQIARGLDLEIAFSLVLHLGAESGAYA